MSKIVYCHTECFHGNVLWNVGDEMEVEEGETYPHHFKDTPVWVEKKARRPMTSDAREVEVSEAPTFHEMTRRSGPDNVAANLDAPLNEKKPRKRVMQTAGK